MKCFSGRLMTPCIFVTKLISHLTSESCGTSEFEGRFRRAVWGVWTDESWAGLPPMDIRVHVNNNQVLNSNNLNHFTDWFWSEETEVWDGGYEGSLAEQKLKDITFQETTWNARKGSAPLLVNACLKEPHKTLPVQANQAQQGTFISFTGDKGWDL